MHVPDSFDLRDAMRGEDQRSEVLFSYVRLESRIPADHPLRAIRTLIDEALNGLSRDFNKLYARDGRPSIPPERSYRQSPVRRYHPTLRLAFMRLTTDSEFTCQSRRVARAFSKMQREPVYRYISHRLRKTIRC